MATVRKFTVVPLNEARPLEDVEAIVRLVDCESERLIQIDTYDPPTREKLGKLSQTIRLDKAAFEKLAEIGSKHF